MIKILKYFYPANVKSYFDELRIRFYIILCLIAIVIISLAIVAEFIHPNSNLVVSLISKSGILFVMFVSLFILKFKGIRIAGNIFSFATVLLVLIFMNVLSEDINPMYKFIQSFYSIYVFVAISVLFASNIIIFINLGLVLVSTLHVYLFALKHFNEDAELFTAGFINHTFVIIAITLVVFYASKLMQKAVDKANDEIAQRENNNQELLSSEEEIIASNEELVATTNALVEANEELRLAKGKAEESDRLKTEFLNNMSHEVRTPMNGIIGFAQLVELPDISVEARTNYINVIQQSSKQLLSIIDNIIEISKLGTKQVKVYEEAKDLNKLLTELYTVFDIKAIEKKLELFLLPECSDYDSVIMLDEVKLYKILSNLLENAIKFTEKGKIEFGYSIIDEDDHNLKNNYKAIRFFVKDTGIGVAEDKKESIFNKFTQAEEFLSRQYGGLGLGLSIAKENTELLGGTIEIESKLNEGTNFYITIPLRTNVNSDEKA